MDNPSPHQHQQPVLAGSADADQRVAVATVDDLDWNQLDLALDKYTTVFELPSVHDAPGGGLGAPWQPKQDPASPLFEPIPFPHSPGDEPAIFAPHDLPFYAGTDMLGLGPFPHRQPLFHAPSYNPVFSVDTDASAFPDHVIDSPSDPFLLDSPWMSAAGPDTPLTVAGSPTFAHAQPPPLVPAPGSLPAPQAIRPLMLAHRTSLPISIPSTPYRPQQRFIQHSAPAAYSPIRQVRERRHSTMAAGDDAPRKRKRTPDPFEKEKTQGPPQRSELHPPKQAPSTWQVFFADWLEDHRARNPKQRLNVAQAAKEAGQVYHNLKPEERERLKARAQEAKEDRERELAEWKRKLTPDDIRRENAFRAAQRKAGKSRKGNLKDPNAPKKPLSAYFMFLQKIRSSPQLVQEVFGDETETTKQSVLAAAKWRSLSDAEKKPFLVQAEQDKIAYENARRLYEDRHTGNIIYRSSGDLGHGSTTSVLAYGSFAADVATDDESEGLSDPHDE